MKASPAGEVVILLFALAALLFVLYREYFDKNKRIWRLGLSDFFARPLNKPNEKSVAVLALGVVMGILLILLLIQRIVLLWN